MSEYRRVRAYAAGKKAALEGKPRDESCDRQPGTIFFDDWHDGYNEGERGAVAPSIGKDEAAEEQWR